MVTSTAGSQSPRANRSEPILIVEYDRQSTRLLDSLLLQVSGDLLVVRSGLAALDAIVSGTFGLVIIGIELPDMTTLELLRHLRQVSDVPIIVVAREYEAETLVRSLDGGADDYIARPYPPMELAARVRAVLRRARPRTPEPGPYVDDQIRIDFRTNMVTTARGSVALSATERSLLSELVANEGCVVTHSELAVHIWGEEYPGATANLHVFASQLRHKVEPDPARPVYLHTHRGVGYAFAPPERPPSPPQAALAAAVEAELHRLEAPEAAALAETLDGR